MAGGFPYYTEKNTYILIQGGKYVAINECEE